MSGGRITTWGVIGSVLAVCAVAIWQFSLRPASISPSPSDSPSDSGPVTATVDQAALAAQYQAAVNGLLPTYRQAVSDGDEAEMTAVRDRLLALTLPKEGRDIHVALVLLLEQRLDGTVTASAAEQRLQSLVAEAPWLQTDAY